MLTIHQRSFPYAEISSSSHFPALVLPGDRIYVSSTDTKRRGVIRGIVIRPIGEIVQPFGNVHDPSSSAVPSLGAVHGESSGETRRGEEWVRSNKAAWIDNFYVFFFNIQPIDLDINKRYQGRRGSLEVVVPMMGFLATPSNQWRIAQ